MIQTSLFPQFQEDTNTSFSVEEVAESMNVSTASVRNWIKTGYLELARKNRISQSSVNAFRSNVAGNEKLTGRANKSLKDSHDHDQLTSQFQKLLNDDSVNGISLAKTYEESLSDSYKNKEGIYYTPDEIVQRFFDFLPDDCSELTFCDPCCGTGNFLIAALKHGFKQENIIGFDVDATAVKIAKKRIFEYSGIETNTILCTNFLELQNHQALPVDVIFTNPPWGKKINKARKEQLSITFQTGKSKDTSAIFFFACLHNLNSDGYLGLLLQDAFFNVASYEHARQAALSLEIKGLIDFKKPFKGLLTKAKGIILRNREAHHDDLVCCDTGINQHSRLQHSFTSNPKSILNFSCTTDEAAVIEHLAGLEHITLSGQARFGLGIVTGNNKKFAISHPQKGYMPVFRGADIQKDGLRNPSVFIPDDLSLYQQVAPVDLYQAEEKLIYKFISSNLMFFLDTEQRFLLNSANMLILNKHFPISTVQLRDVLNSRLINWFFTSVFDTHKVLRSDIESLPIHSNYFKVYEQFSESSFLDFLGIEEATNGTFRVKK